MIKELLIRGDLERRLVVAPGGLVEQWQDEMAEKFGMALDILSRDQIEASLSGNRFAERNRLIVRLDMTVRSDELQAKIARRRNGTLSSATRRTGCIWLIGAGTRARVGL